MKKIDVLLWGVAHVARNHGFNYSTDYEREGEVCVWGGYNVPTFCDIAAMCDDLGIEKSCVEGSEFGIDIYVTSEWLQNEGNAEYVETGLELWKRYNAVIGQ